MNEWTTKIRAQMTEEILGSGLGFINRARFLESMSLSPAGDKLLFRLFVLARWKKIFENSQLPVKAL